MVALKVTEPQADFLAMDAKYPAFVAGFGTGKSQIMCDSALMDSLEGGASSMIAMYEPTYDLVRLILAPRMEEKLQEWGIRYNYNKSENIIYTSNGQMGDFVLRTLDNPARIVGYESFRAKIDELDTLKPEHAREAWIKIVARNRQKPSTYNKMSDKPLNTVSVFTTPEGFRFVYDRWKKNPTDDYKMIQASTLSNPFLPDDYVDGLRASYPEQLIEAYINGEFVNLTSGSVYPEFNRALNHSDETLQPSEPVYVGMDFNVNNMTAVIHVKRDGEPVAVDELYGLRDTPTMITAIQERFDGHKIYVYPDSSGKNNKSNLAGLTDISQLKAAGFTLKYKETNPFVRDRVNCVNAMICAGDGARRYKINTKKCPNATENLEQQVYDKNGEPDKKSDNDHGNDCVGYFLAYDYPIRKPVGRLAGFDDY